MSTNSTPETVLASTLRQLITAIQLMQSAVDTLNVVTQSNAEMSNALTAALNAMVLTESGPIADSSAATNPVVTTTVDATTSTLAPTSEPVAAPTGSSAADRVLRALQTIMTPATPADEDTTIWYGVIVGRNPGLFYGSDGVPANVDRIPGGKVVRFTMGREDAVASFNRFLADGKVERVELVNTRTVLQPGDSTIPGLQ